VGRQAEKIGEIAGADIFLSGRSSPAPGPIDVFAFTAQFEGQSGFSHHRQTPGFLDELRATMWC